MTKQAVVDTQWMNRAVALARRGEGLTRPNPPVGAVLVRGREVVGEGYHRKAGTAHAEVLAFRRAGAKARGATLYVTLEPCSTMSRTPPCVDAILEQGVTRVVVGVRDPNPNHRGRGFALLRRAGVEVRSGVLKEACTQLIAPFEHWIRLGRPQVTLKLGMTLDGRIADRKGRSQWITGGGARRHVQAMRRRADAIMVGAGTARADNPSLLPRPARGRMPWRVVVSSDADLSSRLTVLTDAAADRTIVTACRKTAVQPSWYGKESAAEILPLQRARGGVSLRGLLAELGKRGVLSVLCEGGGQLAGRLVQDDLVDEYVFFMAPSLLGGDGARSAIEGAGWLMPGRPHLSFRSVERVGEDLMICAEPKRGVE